MQCIYALRAMFTTNMDFLPATVVSWKHLTFWDSLRIIELNFILQRRHRHRYHNHHRHWQYNCFRALASQKSYLHFSLFVAVDHQLCMPNVLASCPT